jgi:UPF0176 protein
MTALYNRINKEELKRRMAEDKEPRQTVSFYRYVKVEDPHQFRDQLYRDLSQMGVLGRIYVAFEGINAQISVPQKNWEKFCDYIFAHPYIGELRLNTAVENDDHSFYLLKIKVRDKIVADGLNDDTFDVTDRGQHLDAVRFNELAENDQTIIVDMRNHYEAEVGHFEGAITPPVETFREALPYVVDLLKEHKDKPVVMYCTGGIRCEKASAYLKHRGFKDVYQLDGGIINYAHQVEEKGLSNKFKGKNFVFDDRLGEHISEEVIAHCHQCGKPCDHHVNCAQPSCHILFIQCAECASEMDNCCSPECKEIMQLPEEERAEARAKLPPIGINHYNPEIHKGRVRKG